MIFIKQIVCHRNNHTFVVNKSNSLFQGTQCFQNSTYPASKCARTRACCCDSTCVLWKSGKLLIPPYFKQSYSVDKLLAVMDNQQPCSDDFNQNGYFYNGLWKLNTTSSQCSVLPISPLQTHFLVQDHVIVFVGDSMMRQFYNRFVWHLRNFEEVIEHYYHLDALYSTSDVKDHFGVKGSAELKHVHNESIEVHYIWDVDVGHSVEKVRNIFAASSRKHRVYVAGINHWRYDIADNEANNITSIIQMPNMKFFWYLAPNPYDYQGVRDRNVFYTEFAQNHGGFLLPAYLMWDEGTFQPNFEDHIHYQCSYRVQLGSPIELDNYKAPKSGDCRDLFNLNLVYILLNKLISLDMKTIAAATR